MLPILCNQPKRHSMNTQINLGNVRFSALLRKHLKKKCAKYFPHDINFFLKPNDGISYLPLIGADHDEEVSQSLIYLARFLPDCLIDVGANIGLISLQVGGHVKKTICIEPNPVVCNILRSNMLLNVKNFEIFEVGIGKDDGSVQLVMPTHNLGGAFVMQDNSYSINELARKDGFESFDPSNYITQTIKIESCSAFFRKIDLTSYPSLLIKIDIEGQDFQVVEELIGILHEHFAKGAVAIIFESHNLALPLKLRELLGNFNYSVINPRIRKSPSIRNAMIRRFLKLFVGESKFLEFCPLEDPVDTAYRNYICIHREILSNMSASIHDAASQAN